MQMRIQAMFLCAFVIACALCLATLASAQTSLDAAAIVPVGQ